MGFFKELFQRILGNDLGSRDRKLDERIRELRSIERAKKSQASSFRTKSVDAWFKLSEQKGLFSSLISVFSPRAVGEIPSMQHLQQKREKEEKERIERLRKTILDCFSTIENLLNSEEISNAEKLYAELAVSIKDLNDDAFSLQYLNLSEKISSAKEEIRLKEIKRRQEEEKRQREEEERLRQEELRKLEREAEERRRKEREAKEYEEKLRQQEEEHRLEEERLKAIVTQKKEDWESFITYLQMNHVQYFYHFTDKLNIQSIKQLRGLYSWKYCKDHDIVIPNPGGDHQSRMLDTRHGLQDYVRLSFCNDHPMAYRKHKDGAELVLLKIKIDVAAFKGTLFSDMNAADSCHSHGGSMQDLQNVNIRATQMSYVRRDDPNFSQHQAECMVKTFIPIEYIVNIDNPTPMYFGL